MIRWWYSASSTYAIKRNQCLIVGLYNISKNDVIVAIIVIVDLLTYLLYVGLLLLLFALIMNSLGVICYMTPTPREKLSISCTCVGKSINLM